MNADSEILINLLMRMRPIHWPAWVVKHTVLFVRWRWIQAVERRWDIVWVLKRGTCGNPRVCRNWAVPIDRQFWGRTFLKYLKFLVPQNYSTLFQLISIIFFLLSCMLSSTLCYSPSFTMFRSTLSRCSFRPKSSRSCVILPFTTCASSGIAPIDSSVIGTTVASS